jgi:hypothetical protein
MLPAPASIAAPPRPKSRASWNPAVPPPPVGGAAVGNGLSDGLGVAACDADGLGVAACDADGLGVAACDADGLGVVTLAVPLDNPVGVAETLAPGENLVGAAEGEDAVQAETATEASMAKVPQPMAVNLALSPVPAVAVRTFMEPPHASGRPGPVSGPGIRNLPAPAEGKSPKAPGAIKGKAHGRTVQTCNGLFITGILGYASRTP